MKKSISAKVVEVIDNIVAYFIIGPILAGMVVSAAFWVYHLVL